MPGLGGYRSFSQEKSRFRGGYKEGWPPPAPSQLFICTHYLQNKLCSISSNFPFNCPVSIVLCQGLKRHIFFLIFGVIYNIAPGCIYAPLIDQISQRGRGHPFSIHPPPGHISIATSFMNVWICHWDSPLYRHRYKSIPPQFTAFSLKVWQV